MAKAENITITITHSTPGDHRIGVPVEYTSVELAAIVRTRSAAADFIDFDDQPDDIVLMELEDNPALRRIVFDAPHVTMD